MKLLFVMLLVSVSSAAFAQTDCSIDGTYADGKSWFINNEKVDFQKNKFTKYGLPRVLGPNDVTKVGTYNGVGVYTETGLKGRAEVIYIPTRTGCEFQPYQIYCGSTKIEKVSTKGNVMTLKVTTTDIKAPMSYNWVSEDAKIVKGQGTAKVMLNIKGMKKDDLVSVYIYVNKDKACPVRGSENFVVEE